MNPPQWTTQRRFVPVHLMGDPNASSFSSAEPVPAAAASSFASDNFAQAAAPVGIDPPPTASLRALRTSAKNPDISLVEPSPAEAASWPVLVFGTPSEYRQAVVQHFQQFGSCNVSEETGRNCLRLEFESQAAADRALEENGRVGPGNFMFGVTAGSRPQSNGSSSECETIEIKPASQGLFEQPKQDKKPSTPWTRRLLSGLTTAVFGADDI